MSTMNYDITMFTFRYNNWDSFCRLSLSQKTIIVALATNSSCTGYDDGVGRTSKGPGDGERIG